MADEGWRLVLCAIAPFTQFRRPPSFLGVLAIAARIGRDLGMS